MPKATKLPSGNWNCRVHSHYEIVDGKKKQVKVSFTAPTKKEVLKMAVDFMNANKAKSNLTVGQALDGYIDMKRNVLSPTTIHSMEQMRGRYFSDLELKRLDKLTQVDVQRWVNRLATDLSPKTIQNIHGFLNSSVTAYMPDIRLNTRLPKKQPIDYYIPSDEEIKAILDYLEGTELYKAVLLAAFGTLRRGEVSALLGSDIDGNIVHITKSMVRVNGYCIVKSPKTTKSNRDIVLPDWVIEAITPKEKTDRVVDLNPGTITTDFGNALKELGLPHFRFHDLRHYAASTMLNLGVPEIVAQKFGGWQSPNMLRRVYGHSMKDYEEKYTEVINEHTKSMK